MKEWTKERDRENKRKKELFFCGTALQDVCLLDQFVCVCVCVYVCVCVCVCSVVFTSHANVWNYECVMSHA